jgi:hyperosmotically inducible protein
MKFIRTFLVLAIMALGFSSSAIHAQNYNSGNVSQAAIEKKVFKAIIRLPYYGLFDNIGYQVQGDTVILSGKVVRPITKSDAAGVVKRINGVASVVNNIEVLPLSSYDDQIRYQVANTLANRGGGFYRYLQGASPSVKIIVDRGNVSLEGYVANKSDANLANILTRSVFGVFNVQNNLKVDRDS